MTLPALIVHGGAGLILEDEYAAYQAGCRAAFEAGWTLLQAGHSALDAVEAAVRVMEDDPAFDAGVGSVLNCVGEIELDAMIMDGANLALGAVAAVRGIANPVTLARRVMEHTSHSVLVGSGARRYAEQIGLRLSSQAELTVPREVTRFKALQDQVAARRQPVFDTVGAVAIDGDGHVAAATSTGGMAFKLPGRVGDSPLVGSGAYADDTSGGASATGHGEMIMRVVLSKTATDLLAAGLTAQEAADRAIAILNERVNGEGGIILVDGAGRIGFAHNTQSMAVAWLDADNTIQSVVSSGTR